jgi:hypothetical protein
MEGRRNGDESAYLVWGLWCRRPIELRRASRGLRRHFVRTRAGRHGRAGNRRRDRRRRHFSATFNQLAGRSADNNSGSTACSAYGADSSVAGTTNGRPQTSPIDDRQCFASEASASCSGAPGTGSEPRQDRAQRAMDKPAQGINTGRSRNEESRGTAIADRVEVEHRLHHVWGCGQASEVWTDHANRAQRKTQPPGHRPPGRFIALQDPSSFHRRPNCAHTLV